MNVFAITLRRTPERAAYITKHLAGLKLDFQVVNGIDFNDYGEDEYARFFDAAAIARNPFWTKGVVACTLSHLKIYEEMVSRNIPIALVVEDDAILPADIESILERVEGEIGTEEIIALSYHNHDPVITELSTRHRSRLSRGLELLYPVNVDAIASGMGYVLTLETARKLLEMNTPVQFPCDNWGTYFHRGGFRSLRCVYPVQVMPASFRTTIDYAASKTLKSRFAAWVRKNRVPVLFGMLEKRSSQMLETKYRFQLVDAPPFTEPQTAS